MTSVYGMTALCCSFGTLPHKLDNNKTIMEWIICNDPNCIDVILHWGDISHTSSILLHVYSVSVWIIILIIKEPVITNTGGGKWGAMAPLKSKASHKIVSLL